MAGNWKMNINHLESIAYMNKLAFSLIDADYARTEIVIFPPFTDIRSVQTVVDADHLSITYGAQDISAHDSGAYTGEISGAMLKKLHTKYALIGHSERRAYHNETDESVNAKVKAAIKHDLIPMIAVGETLDIRQSVQAMIVIFFSAFTFLKLDSLRIRLGSDKIRSRDLVSHTIYG